MFETTIDLKGRLKPLLQNLRARDVQELREHGTSLEYTEYVLEQPAVVNGLFPKTGTPIAVVAFHRLTPRALGVSLLATEEWPSVALSVVRWGVRTAKPALLAQGFVRAECRTMAGHEDAIRLLEHLGFVRECEVPGFGASGKTFIQFAWRLNDHVPINTQSSQGRTAAAGAAS